MGQYSIRDRIDAAEITIEKDVSIGPNSTIQANKVILGNGVHIGDHVRIACDTLHISDECRIESSNEIICPEIALSEGCSVGENSRVHLNDFLVMGKHSAAGRRFSATGRGFKCGEFLWLKDDVIIGGGGANGPRSYLTIGNGTTIIDKCFINLSEEVSIGNNTALSYNVVILTHGAWQPLLMGYTAKFAPVHIGSCVVIYLNSVILPGVSIGDYVAVGANSLVMNDIPDHCLATGNPAKIKKGPLGFPQPIKKNEIDSLLISLLMDYITTLPSKNVRVLEDRISTDGYVVIEHENRAHTISYLPVDQYHPVMKRADITLAYGPVLRGHISLCHFDLSRETINGELTVIAEDLRDYLRRRAIRIMTGRPFKALPLYNLHRLKTHMRMKKA